MLWSFKMELLSLDMVHVNENVLLQLLIIHFNLKKSTKWLDNENGNKDSMPKKECLISCIENLVI